ncbi:PREDICTED: ATP-dependent DNA helicase 2 subunit 1-like [Vollenhovia emeryi]|uniref:ATP-dependent DNA helicase 2 subunit 1-like n=1 Tax=Vollenhovia emeryi TaxID=411798 RepID=UPI0005F3D0E4|nr:PREDICTED: ATP-dependent DNA helicase 2 subunit 1-like [Vollenhovia emeryi]
MLITEMALDVQDYNMDGEEESQTSEWYGVREATLFLVDATQKMFEIEPETKLSHIQKFFKLYKQILRQKLAWSMQDWMGVVLFGTEGNDTNSAWKNIQTLHELRVVTLDDLQLVRKLIKSGMKGYQSIKSDDAYPLDDALTYTKDIFGKIKTVLTKRRIVLITCHSSKLPDDEKHRIRSKAASLKDVDIKLHVIGLGKDWTHDQFYKDLEMLSRKTDVGVYRMTSLMDLVQQIKAPSKNIARLCFQMYDGLEIDLVVRTLGRKRRCLRTKPLSKATNQVLSRSTYFKSEDLFNEENSDSEELDLPFVIPEEVNLESKELIGGTKLRFTQTELYRLKHTHPPGIKIIGVRPIPDDLFRYHVKRKYFLRADYSSTRKDNLLFFGALLNKCAAKGKMVVCTFTLRMNTQTNLCYMIPNADLGGFYLSKVAYQGNIGDKSEALIHYDTQNRVTDEQVALWKKTIDQLDMDYHPYKFKSYKLECQIQIVEKLALDKEPGPSPIDSIEQSFLRTYKKTTDLTPEFKNMYPDTSKSDGPTKAKRVRKTKET